MQQAPVQQQQQPPPQHGGGGDGYAALWDSYVVVADKMTAGKRAMKELGVHLSERAVVESTFSKNLLKAAQNETKYAHTDTKSTKEAWTALRNASEVESKAHQVFAAQLSGQILDELTTAKNELSLSIRRLFGEADKVQKELKLAKDHVLKCQKNYQKAIKDSEAAIGQEAKAELTDAITAVLEKARAKAQLSVKGVDEADRQYVDAVKGCRLTQTKHDETITKILEEFQAMETKRIETMKLIHSKCLHAHHQLYLALQQNMNSMKQSVDGIDAATDIRQFVQATLKPGNRPDPIEQEKVKSPVLETYRTKMKQEQHYTRVNNKVSVDDPRVVAKALFAYQPYDNKSELQFEANDIILIARKDQSGWWLGETRGRFGLVPSNYVTMLGDDPRRPSIDGRKLMGGGGVGGTPPKHPGQTPLAAQQSFKQRPASGQFGTPATPYTPSGATDFSERMERRGSDTDASVYYMRSVSQSSLYPPSQLAQMPPGPPQQPEEARPSLSQEMSTEAVVEFTYMAQSEDELTIYQGETVRIITEESGWCMGTNVRNETGVFPANYCRQAH